MERLLSAKEVGALIGYRDGDAVRRAMRQMIHTEKPLRVTESALQKWINERSYRPGIGDRDIGIRCQEKGRNRVPEAERIPRRK